MSPSKQTRILVLDDDPLLRRAIEHVASVRGDALVAAVATPGELREELAAATEPFHLVVCDFQLRNAGRATTSAELVRELAEQGLPIAVMTGDVRAARAVLGSELAMLEKPIRLDDILAEAERQAGS
jgi:CheY-like chemotaxis protein